MMPEQLNLLSDGWVRRHELREFSDMVRAAFKRGHLDEPGYDFATSWPTMARHPAHGRVLAWMQRAERACSFCGLLTCACTDCSPVYVFTRRRSPGECNVWRVVITDAEGYVVDESGWCTTEGGARGYRLRHTADHTPRKALT